MPPNSKWPDFRLASTLWSLVSSPSNAPDKESIQEKETSPSQASNNRAPSNRPSKKHRSSKGENSKSVQDNDNSDTEMMAELEDHPIDNTGDFDNYEGPEHDAQAAENDNGSESDFGPIEMFDTNSTQQPFISQPTYEEYDEPAPEAVMTAEEVPASKPRRATRDKKKSNVEIESSQPANEDEVPRKSRKSKKKSKLSAEAADSPPLDEASMEPEYISQNEAVVPFTQSKRKRRSVDAADAKQRKKRKPQDRVILASQEVAEETQDREDGASLNAALATDMDGANVDAPKASQESIKDNELGTESFATHQPKESEAGRDVESLAREAWNEHVNGQAHEEDAQLDGGMKDPSQSLAQDPETHDAGASARKSRSSRGKKANPTYFKKSPSPAHDAMAEMPLDSAMTPQPRKRAKPATKRKKKQAASQRSPESDEDDGYGARRNKTGSFTQGRFSDEELSRIAKAVEAFRAENDMVQFAVNELIHAPGGTTAGEHNAILWNRIFAECPDRHRQKIINTTRKKFHNFVARATWTIEQDAELRDLIEANGTKWSKIAAIINRHPEDVRDRYRNYIVCGDNQRKDAWDEQEEARLTQYVIEAMEVIDELRLHQPSRELLKKPYEELIDWQNISERMDRTRSRLQCITKWKAMHIKTNGRDKLVSREPNAQISFRLEKARRQMASMPDEERFRLLLAIQGSGATVESKIPWQKLLDKQFRKTWHRSTQMLLWRRLKLTVPGHEQMATRDIAQYLLDQYNQIGELPEVTDEEFENTEEMEFLETVPVSIGGRGRSEGKHVDVSEAFIHESDVEGDIDMAEPAAVDHDELLEDVVDPALSETKPMSTPVPNVKSASEKKSTAKKGRKSKKSVQPQEPIEDNYDESMAHQEEGNNNGSEIDEEQYRSKKKTPGKFKQAVRNDNLADNQLSDSVMDDMEDLPARIAAA